MAKYLSSNGVENPVPSYIGGKMKQSFGWIKRVQAIHSSSTPDGADAGQAAGFVIDFFGHHIYFAGDTALFGDMALIGNYVGVDTALLPIGGYYTMDIDDAVEAVKMLKCKNVIPMHYDTFDLIKADPYEFKRRVEESTTSKVLILKPGESAGFKVPEHVMSK